VILCFQIRGFEESTSGSFVGCRRPRFWFSSRSIGVQASAQLFSLSSLIRSRSDRSESQKKRDSARTRLTTESVCPRATLVRSTPVPGVLASSKTGSVPLGLAHCLARIPGDRGNQSIHLIPIPIRSCTAKKNWIEACPSIDEFLPIDRRVQHIYVLLSRLIVSAKKQKKSRSQRRPPSSPRSARPRTETVWGRASLISPSTPALCSAVCLVGRAICIATLWSPIATRLTKTQVALLVLDQTSLL
jgi:hypothetical protein